MSEVRWLNNLKGILYYLDQPLIDFEIKDRSLVRAEDLSGGAWYPPELAVWGVTYGNFNAFFQRRTMKEGCMFYKNRLKAYGMDKIRYDFDLYIKKNNGNNNLDNFWVKFEDFGATCFDDICNQDYPVI